MSYNEAIKLICRVALHGANGSLIAKEIIEAVRIVKEHNRKK